MAEGGEISSRFQARPQSEIDKEEKSRNSLGGTRKALAVATVVVAGMTGVAVMGHIEPEGPKPEAGEVFEGSVGITNRVNNDDAQSELEIFESPNFFDGGYSEAKNVSRWQWKNTNTIVINNPLIISREDPYDHTSDELWIEIPVTNNGNVADVKYIPWGPSNHGHIEVLGKGKFVKGELTKDGSFTGKNNTFSSGELSQVTTTSIEK